MQQESSLPILYTFRRCPYAIRARLTLRYSQTHVELREVVLRDKPEGMLTASPKGTVPVLVLSVADANQSVLEESLDIMRWALDRYDPDGWLAEDGDITTDLIERNDSEFKYWLDRYKYPEHFSDIGDVDPLERCNNFLWRLDEMLTVQEYLLGDRLTLADIALFPFVRQFAFVDKASFDAGPFAALQAWLNGLLQTVLFESIMNKYPPWKQGDNPTIF